MNQSYCSLGFLSQNSLWNLSTFRGYKGIYSRIWEGMWKDIFLQNKGALVCDSRLRWVASSNLQLTEWLDCIFCLVVIQLYWSFNFFHASQVWHSWRVTTCELVASSNRENALECTHLINSSHSLTYNPYIIPT